MQLHPDSEGANASRDKFEELTAAYEVLSDPGTRSTYDQVRHWLCRLHAVHTNHAWGREKANFPILCCEETVVAVTHEAFRFASSLHVFL